MPSKKPLPQEAVIDNTTLDRALAANKRRRFVQTVVNSNVMKIVATVFLLSALFSASFVVAYQQIQKQQLHDALKEVPEAEVTVPNIVEYANSQNTPTVTPDITPGVGGSFCGGIAGITCPSGYNCKLDGNYPDAGGTCVSGQGQEGKKGTCRATGCSGQICSDEDIASTCEFKEEYACYASATCERQANGKCGWTETNELTSCLGNN